MNISKLFCGFVPRLKQNPLAGAMLSGLGSLGSSLFSQEAQQRENEEAREWQEEMWNKTNEYNSPKNQRKLLEEAGYNPYLFGDDYKGSGASLPSAPSNQPLPRLDNPVLGASQLFQQGLQVESNVELQHAKALESVTDTLIKAYQEGGQKLYDKVYDGIKPVIDRINWTGSSSEIEFNERINLMRSQRYNIDMDSLNKDFMYETSKKWTNKEKQAHFDNLKESTRNIIQDIALKVSQEKLNYADLKRVASEIARNFAEAFAAEKQGEFYVVNGRQMTIINGMLGLDFQDALADFNWKSGIRSFKNKFGSRETATNLFLGGLNAQGTELDLQSNKFLRYGKAVTSMVGDVFKVNVGMSTSNTNFRNFTPNDNNGRFFYSGDGYYLNNGTLMKGDW